MDYSDFDIEVLPKSEEGGEYAVRVAYSPAGEASDRMHFPFTQTEIKERLDTLQSALRRDGNVYRSEPPEGKNIREFGQGLFEALFAGKIRICYEVSLAKVEHEKKGLRINLRIQAPELAALPWEYLYNNGRQEYVCFSRTTSIVRYLNIPRPIQSLTVSSPLRILGMTASPSDHALLDIEHEKSLIHGALHNLIEKGLVEIDWLPEQTWRSLQDRLRKDPNRPYHIFHFIGHGGFDTATDEGFIALVDEKDTRRTKRIPATQLKRVLMNYGPLRLVILNACEGARGSEQDIFSSTASILAQEIPAVVAMQYVITDEAAIELARTFYKAIADGMAVDEAMTEARIAMSMSTLEWGVPVLYMRSHDGKLFGIPQAETQQPEVLFLPSIAPPYPQTDVPSPVKSASLTLPLVNKRKLWLTRRRAIGLGFGSLGLVTLTGIAAYGQRVITYGKQGNTGNTPTPVSVPGIGGWVPTGSMQNKRTGHSAIQLLDGTVLVAAGRTPPSLVTQAERFYPQQGIWKNAGKVNTPRITSGNALVVLQKGKHKGYALLVGGANVSLDKDYGDCELYNPAANSWQYTASLNQARRSATPITLPDGRVLVIGGSYGLPTPYRFQERCELFDPDTETWTYTSGVLALPRELALAAILPNETVLIVGGDSQLGFTNWAEVYDIKQDTFFTIAAMPWACREGSITVLSDGRVLVAGGVNQDKEVLNKAVAYNYRTNTWHETGLMQDKRSGHAAFLLSGDRVLVTGGTNEKGEQLDTSEVFNLASNAWSPGPRISSPRAAYRLISLTQGRALAIGGNNGDAETEAGTLATCDLFMPDPS